MKKKKGQKLSGYSHRFLTHLKNFIETNHLFRPDDQLVLGVSGGLDSMVLLHALQNLRNFGYSNKLRVITINHGTREGQKKETDLVKNYAFSLGIKAQVEQASKQIGTSNFEAEARRERYHIFYKNLKSNQILVLGHHIDDSFEWSLLQQLRSGSLKGSLGIPVKSRSAVRPFLCLTKQQLELYALDNEVPYLEDPTNEEIKYERNYLRKKVIPKLKTRHQKYLKHYVNRQNELAKSLGVHVSEEAYQSFRSVESELGILGYSFSEDAEFSGIEAYLTENIKKLNPESRGVTALQFKKVKHALKNGKLGPLNISGGIKIYLDHNMFLMTKTLPGELKIKELGEQSLDQFKTLLHSYLNAPEQVLSFPFYVEILSPNLDMRQFATSFNKEGVDGLKRREANFYPALRLLREWSKKRNKHKKLSLNLLLVKN